MMLKRFVYTFTHFKHDCAETIQDYPQPVYADDKVFIRCPICKKKYRIQFASMIKQLIKQILTPPQLGKRIKKGPIHKGGRNAKPSTTPRPTSPKKQK